MKKFAGAGLIVAGVILMMCGLDGPDSVGSRLSRMFSEWPPANALWVLFGGAVAVMGGIHLTCFRKDSRA